MPETPMKAAEITALDREIAYQKKLTEILSEEQMPVETLYSWVAPERDFEVKDRKWYVTTAAAAMFFIIVAALTKNYLLIVTIIALVVVIFTVNTIPPHDAKHKLTTRGMYSFNTLFVWKNMICFWVTQRAGKYLLHFEYRGKVSDLNSQQMVILIGRGNLEKIATYMVRHVDYLGPSEITENVFSKWAQGRYIPLLEIVGEKDIATKDPNDAPFMLKAAKQERVLPKRTSAVNL